MTDASTPAYQDHEGVSGTSVAARLVDWCVGERLQVVSGAGSDRMVVAFPTDAQVIDIELDTSGSKARFRHEAVLPRDALSLTFPGIEGVASPTTEEVFRRIVDSRWGPLTGTAATQGAELHITVECGCYSEDLTRTAFVNALAEVAKTRQAIDSMASEIAAQRRALGLLDPPKETPSANARPWRPTHKAGPQAWTWLQPDSATSRVSQLDPGLEVMVVETQNGWAHIVCSNDWSAWTDLRQLHPIDH